MSEGKSSVSGATSYQEVGEYWDEHDLADVWDQTEPVEMELDLEEQLHADPAVKTRHRKPRQNEELMALLESRSAQKGTFTLAEVREQLGLE